MTILRWLTACLVCLVVGGIAGAVLTHWYDRPLSGPITAAGVAFEKAVPDAGIAEATPVTLGEVKRDVAQLVADGGLLDLKPWLAKNGAHPDAVTTGLVTLQGQVVPGKSTVDLAAGLQAAVQPCRSAVGAAGAGAAVAAGVAPGSRPEGAEYGTSGTRSLQEASLAAGLQSPAPAGGAPWPAGAVVVYDWHSTAPDGTADGRYSLHDPDVLHPGRAVFIAAPRRLKLAVIGIQQDGSPLRQEQVALTEIDAQGHDIGPATITDLKYSYVPAPSAPKLLVSLYAGLNVPHVAQPIALFSGPLVFGAGVQWRAGPVWVGGLVLNPGIVLGTAGWAL